MRLPVFTSLRGYRRGWLRGDAVAGLTVWAVLVPEALAYASIAGVSPVVGLYAAPGALIFYAAFGSSKHLVTGPMAATAALSAAAVGQVAAGKSGAFPALTVTLAITTGVLALAAGLARLGFVANFISEPVLKGFIVGVVLRGWIGRLGVGEHSGNLRAGVAALPGNRLYVAGTGVHHPGTGQDDRVELAVRVTWGARQRDLLAVSQYMLGGAERHVVGEVRVLHGGQRVTEELLHGLARGVQAVRQLRAGRRGHATPGRIGRPPAPPGAS